MPIQQSTQRAANVRAAAGLGARTLRRLIKSSTVHALRLTLTRSGTTTTCPARPPTAISSMRGSGEPGSTAGARRSFARAMLRICASRGQARIRRVGFGSGGRGGGWGVGGKTHLAFRGAVHPRIAHDLDEAPPVRGMRARGNGARGERKGGKVGGTPGEGEGEDRGGVGGVIRRLRHRATESSVSLSQVRRVTSVRATVPSQPSFRVTSVRAISPSQVIPSHLSPSHHSESSHSESPQSESSHSESPRGRRAGA